MILVGEDVRAFDDDVWELYDTRTDWTQARDLAKEQPERLHELQRLWLIEATRYGVLPLDDRGAERFQPEIAGRPTLIKGSSQLLFGGMGRVSESSVLNIKNKSHSVTAEVVAPQAGAEGVIIAQCDVGMEGGALVTDDYGAGDNAFTGEVSWVQIDIGADGADADHYVGADERLNVAMARQ